MRQFIVALCGAAVPLLAFSSACTTQEKVTFVNETDARLYVTINEREPFGIDAGAAVTARLPALQQLVPVTITARDDRGATVFFQTTSVTRLVRDGKRVVLKATDRSSPPT